MQLWGCITRYKEVDLKSQANENNSTRKGETMNKTQLRNAKIDAVTMLQSKYNRFAKGREIEGVDVQAIEKTLEQISEQMRQLEAEIAALS